MRDTQLNRFAIIRSSGQAENAKDGSTYWSILDAIFQDYQSTENLPTMLLHNGKVVVEKGLYDLAWKYGTAKRDALNAAAEKVRVEHAPEWLLKFEEEANRAR